MKTSLRQLVGEIELSPVPTDILYQIAAVLQQQSIGKTVSSFISQSSDELLILEKYAWQLLSQDTHLWINQPHYQEFFQSLVLFNKNVVFNCSDIDIDVKASLLFPVTIDQINTIFTQLNETNNDNDPYITIVGLYFDNHSYFLDEYPQQDVLTITDCISQSIAQNYVMSEQFKAYLSHLRQPQPAQSMFTSRMLFYIKTGSLALFEYKGARMDQCPYDAHEILRSIRDDYMCIVHVHSLTVASWSKELLECLAHLISFVSVSYLWLKLKQTPTQVLFSNDQVMYDHVDDLIRIVAHGPLQEQIKETRSNSATALIDGALLMLVVLTRSENMAWFFQSNTAMQDVVLTIAERSSFDALCLRAYGILGAVLSTEQLKNLKNLENINLFFFKILQTAWHHPSKKYKRIPIENMLQGYLRLLNHDLIKQKTADAHTLPVLIEMCDAYPVMYDILWTLSFNHDIQEQLRSDTTFIAKLYHLSNEYENEQIRKSTQGILWNLQFSRKDFPTVEEEDAAAFDIMISYSHKDKVLCKRIYDELIKQGYHVWIDFDQMHGNAMDAMAYAIDRCPTVIICISDHYRQSNYCRAEAQYAFQRQRKIVPVLLQKHYKPDGWLLFLVGQLLYIDFTKYEFNQAIDMLERELETDNSSEITVATTGAINGLPLITPTASPSVRTRNILEWSQVEVQQWLLKHDLVQMSRLLDACDGQSLVYLNGYLKHGDPQQISRSLDADSMRWTNQSLSLIELSRLQSLLDCETKRVRPTVPARSVLSHIVGFFSTVADSCDIL